MRWMVIVLAKQRNRNRISYIADTPKPEHVHTLYCYPNNGILINFLVLSKYRYSIILSEYNFHKKAASRSNGRTIHATNPARIRHHHHQRCRRSAGRG